MGLASSFGVVEEIAPMRAVSSRISNATTDSGVVHQTLDYGNERSNPTSGAGAVMHQLLDHCQLGDEPTSGDPVLDALRSAVAEMDRERAAARDANAAIPLSALAGDHLGKWERWWLLNAPSEPKPRGQMVFGPSGSKSIYEAVNRARRQLQRGGLLFWYGGVYLSPLGEKVVAAYRHELETGKRIRWPR